VSILKKTLNSVKVDKDKKNKIQLLNDVIFLKFHIGINITNIAKGVNIENMQRYIA
jgi:hypothetical protein